MRQLKFWSGQGRMQRVFERIARCLQLLARLQRFQLAANGQNLRGNEFFGPERTEPKAQLRLLLLLPRRLQAALGACEAFTRSLLRAFGGGDIPVDAGLQGKHAPRGNFARGACLGDLAARKKRQGEAYVERKLGDAVIPVVAWRQV